jgi:hypothetical protein
MRFFARLLAIAFILLLPRTSAAGILEVTIREPMGVTFGTAGADFFSSFGFDDIFIDGVFQETPWLTGFDGNLELEIGTLESLTLTDLGGGDFASAYEYGPGTATLTVDWLDPFGIREEGAFVAPLLGLTIDVRCEAELSITCANPSGYSNGTAIASFGPGLFDPVLAALLHIDPSGEALEFVIALDEITGNPGSARRFSGSSGGEEDFSILVEVPEPTVLSLLLLSSLVAVRRSRLRSRRQW